MYLWEHSNVHLRLKNYSFINERKTFPKSSSMFGRDQRPQIRAITSSCFHNIALRRMTPSLLQKAKGSLARLNKSEKKNVRKKVRKLSTYI